MNDYSFVLLYKINNRIFSILTTERKKINLNYCKRSLLTIQANKLNIENNSYAYFSNENIEINYINNNQSNKRHITCSYLEINGLS